MKWFKNLKGYRLTSKIDFSKIEEALQDKKFTPCGKSDRSHFGFIEPLQNTGVLAYQDCGHILLVSCKEEKILPAYAVNRKLAERAAELEEKEKRKLKKTEKLALKDDVISEMLPHAFSKFTHTSIWIDTNKGLIFVDSSSDKKAEDSLALLRASLGSLPVVPITFNANISDVMTDWLINNNAPEWVMLLEDCKLKDFNIDNEITIKRQFLDDEEILNLVAHENSVVSLSIERENHLSFVLNQDGTIGKIKFKDIITECNDDFVKKGQQQRFAADFILMVKELSDLFEMLIVEFNGVKECLATNISKRF